MKKILVFLFLIIFLTGCQNMTNQNELNDQEATQKQIETLTVGDGVQPLPQEEVVAVSGIEKPDFSDLTPVAETQSILHTSLGDITIMFYNIDAPLTVKNFVSLAKQDFYKQVKFHRVIKDFMVQTGDPNTKDDFDKSLWGRGDPGYKFQDEINQHKLVKGMVAMANSGPNSNGSQFFIVTAKETPWLDGLHTVFGTVTDGMAVVDKIGTVETDQRDRPLKPITIESITLK